DGITFWALGEIVKAEAGILETDPPAQASDKLLEAVAALLPDPSEREWVRARLAPLLGIADPDAVKPERAELFAALRRRIEPMAASGPVVLVVEDLHWADPAMLEFLGHLVERAGVLPLLVVATARPELLERHPGWGDDDPASTRIPLGALSGLETAQLVAALVGRSVLPVGVQALLLERAAGNPLYAEEFARLLADRGLVVEDRAATVPEIPVPETVHGLIAARLDALTPEVRALVQDASVVGRVFWPGAVAAMDGADDGVVQAGLAELERKQLVQRARTSSVQHQDEYAFWHALVRDVAYAQIPRAGRARRHQAVAECVEEGAGAPRAGRRRRGPGAGGPGSRGPGPAGWASRPAASWSWPGTGPSTSTWTGPAPTTARPSSWASRGTPSTPTCWSGPGGWRSSPATPPRRWPSTRRRSPTCASAATSRASAPPWAGWPPSSRTRATPAAPTTASPRPSSS